MATQLNKWQTELEKLTEREYKKTDSLLFNTYRNALKEIKQRLSHYVNAYEQLSFSKKLEVERLFNVALEIDNILNLTYSSVGEIIKDCSANQAAQGYNGVWYQLEQSERIKLALPLIQHDFIMELVNKPVAGKTLSRRLYLEREKLAKVVTNEIIQGLFDGEGYRVIAKRISDQTEASYKQALRIAITESGRTHSNTTQKGYVEAEKLGISIKKKWLATLDKKTRDDHRELDGQTVGVNEKFKIHNYEAEGPRLFGVAKEDVNCRCTTISIVDEVSPELRKDNEFKDYAPFTNYKEWSKNLWGARSAK
ncbi:MULTISPECIES: phage minor head protein [Vagococcus]|uniref:phage minor head protein n=1 Tax=Vagococcus TaxID=2737 RepID=UPI001652161B|nr:MULTISPECIES: phage minor head protein [Vagococcus]